MSQSLIKMWISLAGMGFMFLSLGFIYLSRFKLKGAFKFITAVLAYGLMILSGLIILFVVLSGPTE
ncbi:DUF2768 domain-containing protein [Bacillus marasmi]|uniref:DUF2768 domain-containing protein n=1 Tax=Bacillus marasmi TaxID=1926279 RepID=UPI0011C95F06|nr:DUF2768 domain-containing protein [Bacillus marasmi]